MKRIILAIAAVAIALQVAACGLPTINIQNQVNLNTTEGVVAGYGILANQLNLLKAQPLCKTGTTPSFLNLCVPRSIIVRLQNGMVVAKRAMNSAVAFEAANPTIDPSQYIAAASSAILSVQSVYNTEAAATQKAGG